MALQLNAAQDAAVDASRPIAIPETESHFEQIGGLVVDRAKGTAILSSTVQAPGAEAVTRLAPIDFVAGRAGKPIDVDGEYQALAWDGEGNRLIVGESTRAARRPLELEIWKLDLEEKSVSRTFAAQPVTDDAFGSRGTTWAAFLTGDRFASLSADGRFAIWSLASGEPVATTTLGHSCGAAASLDGSVVALASTGRIVFVDVERATSIGLVESDLRVVSNVAFSPDGQLLAAAGFGQFQAVRLDTGTTFDVPNVPPASNLLAFGDGRRLFVGPTLLDVVTGKPIVSVGFGLKAAVALDGTFWLYADDGFGKGRALVPYPALPPGVAEKLVDARLDAGAEPLFAEGAPLRIDVSGVDSKKRRDDVVRTLSEAAKRAGHAIDERADVTLVVSTERGEKLKFDYVHSERGSLIPQDSPVPASRGGAIGIRTVQEKALTISPAILKVKLVKGDETIWSESISQLPREFEGLAKFGFGTDFDIPRGKTIEEFVRDVETFDYDRFAEFYVPPKVVALEPPPEPILGRRRLTTTGLQ